MMWVGLIQSVKRPEEQKLRFPGEGEILLSVQPTSLRHQFQTRQLLQINILMCISICTSTSISTSTSILLALFLRRSWLIQVGRERREAGRSLMASAENQRSKSRKRNVIISIIFRFLIHHDLALVINLFLTKDKKSPSQ